MQYPAGEIQTPLHSAGERANDVIGARSKSDRLEGALTRSAQRVTREVIHSAPELEILPRREVEIEGNCLRHDSNERARRRTSVDVYAVDGDLARIARENSRDHRDGSGLAGAVGTQQAVNLTRAIPNPIPSTATREPKLFLRPRTDSICSAAWFSLATPFTCRFGLGSI